MDWFDYHQDPVPDECSADERAEELEAEVDRLLVLARSLRAGSDDLPEWARLRVAAMLRPHE